MGSDKALLTLEGRPLIAFVIAALLAVPAVNRITIVGREEVPGVPESVICLPDRSPGLGPLGGLITALEEATSGHVLLVGCDMPRLQPRLLSGLIELADDRAATVPMWNGKIQPLCAVYGLRALDAARPALRAGRRSLSGLVAMLPDVRIVSPEEIRRLDPDARSFLNVNVPDDLNRLAGP